MLFNLHNIAEANRAFDYLTELNGRECLVDIKKVSPVRSLSQNNFLHLLLTAFGLEFGYSLMEAKTIYKREVNPDVYVYEKNDQKFLKSSADLSKEDMMQSIERFRKYSSEHGLDLPSATDEEYLREIGNKAEMQRAYL